MTASTTKEWCVYIHTVPNGKKYVGITSNSPKRRWSNGRGYKNCVYFNKAIEKYGWENISHEVVATHLHEDEAKNREKQLIFELKTNNPQFGYNLTTGGDGTPGVHRFGADSPYYGKKHTEETKRLMREHHTPHKTGRDKPVLQYSLDGQFIARYESASEAGRSINKRHNTIAAVCRGRGHTAYGSKWFYEEITKEDA